MLLCGGQWDEEVEEELLSVNAATGNLLIKSCWGARRRRLNFITANLTLARSQAELGDYAAEAAARREEGEKEELHSASIHAFIYLCALCVCVCACVRRAAAGRSCMQRSCPTPASSSRSTTRAGRRCCGPSTASWTARHRSSSPRSSWWTTSATKVSRLLGWPLCLFFVCLF